MSVRNTLLAGAAAATLLSTGASAQLARPSGTQRAQEQTMADVPRCPRVMGTVSIVDGSNPWWTQYNLAPPARLLRVLVLRSGCFRVVDRGTGLQAAEMERGIGDSLGHQRGSNVGQGQIRAADYVLQAEIQGANSNASGSGIGAGIGGLINNRLGGVIGGISQRRMEANTVLSLTNVRTTETLASEDGYASRRSMSFGVGGGLGILGGAVGAVGGGYDNTDIGRIVTLSFIQAYSRLVTSLGYVQPGAEGTAEATPRQTFMAQGPVQMRASASNTARTIRTLSDGQTVYPTGNRNGMWWEVADENDNVGWVLNTRLAPAR